MNAYNLLCGAIHVSSGQFSDFWDFAELIYQRYADLPYNKEIVRRRVLQDIERVSEARGPINQRLAFERLVARDLADAIAEFDVLPDLDEIDKRLDEAYTKATKMLRDLGLKFSDPDFFIVDQFPEPYHKMDWVAFAPDKADQEQYGIKSGVYLLRSELAPYYSELTLAHELIHVIIGISNPYLLGRGLEEGIAELVGTLYIGSYLYSPRIARNIFLHTRLGGDSSQLNRLYFDYTRQAFLIYRHFGLDGLIYLIQSGRDLIKEVEEKCLSGKSDDLSLPAGHWDVQLTNLAEDLLLGFIPNLVVSPLAAYIAKFVTPTKTVEEIAAEANADPGDIARALEEIQERTFTLLVDKEGVAYSDLPFITKSRSLRYEVISDDL